MHIVGSAGGKTLSVGGDVHALALMCLPRLCLSITIKSSGGSPLVLMKSCPQPSALVTLSSAKMHLRSNMEDGIG